MKDKRITIWYLALQNLKKKKQQSIAICLIIAIFTATMFGGGIFLLSLKQGVRATEERLGADLMVIPKDSKDLVQSVLVNGCTGYFYMDKELVKGLDQVEGIQQKTMQYYFASAGSACCDMPVEIIGFHPDTDFVVGPWIQKRIKKQKKQVIIAGSEIPLNNKKAIRIYDQEYEVTAQMDQTGTNMDQTVFVSMDMMEDIYHNARELGFQFVSGEEADMRNKTSAVLVNIEEAHDINKVASEIKSKCPQAEVVVSNELVSAVSQKLSIVTALYPIMIVALMSMLFVALFAIYSLIVTQRKKELALLRMIGMKRSKIVGILLAEVLFMSGVSLVVGIAMVSLGLFPFELYIGDVLEVPYIRPGAEEFIRLMVENAMLVLLANVLSILITTKGIYKKDVYQTVREGD